MITAIGETEWRAMEQSGAIKEMDIAIELKKFIMETYDNGAPKRFASEIQILTKSGKNIETIAEVNKPYEVDGWKIYQYGYDTQMGPEPNINTRTGERPVVAVGLYRFLHDAGRSCADDAGGIVEKIEKCNEQGAWGVLWSLCHSISLCLFLL